MRACWFAELTAILLAFSIMWGTSPAAAQRKVALVIGNANYTATANLANPKNDAIDVAAKLKKLGFEIFEGQDLTKAEMDLVIRNFAEAISSAQLALFFYAGHGLQVNGQNYLVPVDAKLTTPAALDFEMVRLDLIQRTMERESSTNIIILDACRDNPLARNLARALGTRSAAIGRGLAAVESGEGTLISYSTQPGNVALDGVGRNSPFAGALVKHIDAPGDDLPTILINVRNDVMTATQRRQVPWEHSALTAKVYFTPPKPAGPTLDQQIELAFWGSVKSSANPAVLGTYVERYPQGEFAPIARALIAHYEQQAKAEQAKRDEEDKRRDAASKAAELERLEDERRARERVLAEERSRSQSPDDVESVKRLEERVQKEALLRAETLHKALEDVLAAREAAKAAEEQRLAAVKAAEQAAAEAAATIDAKRQRADEKDSVKLAGLPKLEQPPVAAPQKEPAADVSERLQKELKRVGCYEGEVDGVWGDGSEAALENFGARRGRPLASLEPDEANLAAVSAESGRICPLTCGEGTVEQNGTCIAKAPGRKNAPVAKTPPSAKRRNADRAPPRERYQARKEKPKEKWQVCLDSRNLIVDCNQGGVNLRF
jgi:uncharacterized caspase-like protein